MPEACAKEKERDRPTLDETFFFSAVYEKKKPRLTTYQAFAFTPTRDGSADEPMGCSGAAGRWSEKKCQNRVVTVVTSAHENGILTI